MPSYVKKANTFYHNILGGSQGILNKKNKEHKSNQNGDTNKKFALLLSCRDMNNGE